METRRRIGDFYSPGWELLPLAVLSGLILFTLKRVVPDLVRTGMISPDRIEPAVYFAPIMGICLYVICTFGGWASLRVEDPTRDLNWLMVRVDPSRVVADPARKERYLGSMLRLLFLMKTVLLLALLAAQVWWSVRS